jgi:hypothetical protein
MVPEKQGENREQVGPGKPPVKHRFKKGRSGNPGGRPKGTSITAILRELLNRPTEDGRVVAEELADVFIERAKAGQFKFAKEILDRTEGKVPDRVEVSGKDGKPLAVLVLKGVSLDDL